jgi:hypothetical protein
MNGTLDEKNKKIRAGMKTYEYLSKAYNQNMSFSAYFNRHTIGCRLNNRGKNNDCEKVIKTVYSINDDLECNTFFSLINSNNKNTNKWKYFREIISNSTTKYMSEFRILPKMYERDEIEKLFEGKNE